MISSRFSVFPILAFLIVSHWTEVRADEFNHAFNEGGFAYPIHPPQIAFPRSHGSHPEFQIEWWYITGHLFAEIDGKRYGFQATFFRNAGSAEDTDSVRNRSAAFLEHSQIYLAHMALVDVETGKFYHQERIHRGGWNAGASTTTLDVFNGNWSLKANQFDDHGDPAVMDLVGSIYSDVHMELALKPGKSRVLFGKDGVSKKGPEPDAASYYITFTRLNVSGLVTIEGQPIKVTGTAWMDHEISSNQLDDRQVGWDWVQMQLDDGTEVMAYRLRQRDGSTDPFSFFNWIDEDGKVTQVGPDSFTWDGQGEWTSPDTGGTYPIAPVLTVTHPETGKTLQYFVRPLVQKQEILGELIGISYWEGSINIENAEGEKIGIGYLELTGYAQDLSERL